MAHFSVSHCFNAITHATIPPTRVRNYTEAPNTQFPVKASVGNLVLPHDAGMNQK
jgi:hypothetical protein